jgi:hypothetical protein
MKVPLTSSNQRHTQASRTLPRTCSMPPNSMATRGDALRVAHAVAREIRDAAIDVIAQLPFELPLHSLSSTWKEIEELPHRATRLR